MKKQVIISLLYLTSVMQLEANRLLRILKPVMKYSIIIGCTGFATGNICYELGIEDGFNIGVQESLSKHKDLYQMGKHFQVLSESYDFVTKVSQSDEKKAEYKEFVTLSAEERKAKLQQYRDHLTDFQAHQNIEGYRLSKSANRMLVSLFQDYGNVCIKNFSEFIQRCEFADKLESR